MPDYAQDAQRKHDGWRWFWYDGHRVARHRCKGVKLSRVTVVENWVDSNIVERGDVEQGT